MYDLIITFASIENVDGETIPTTKIYRYTCEDESFQEKLISFLEESDAFVLEGSQMRNI